LTAALPMQPAPLTPALSPAAAERGTSIVSAAVYKKPSAEKGI
jgi:hypothetical protein